MLGQIGRLKYLLNILKQNWCNQKNKIVTIRNYFVCKIVPV